MERSKSSASVVAVSIEEISVVFQKNKLILLMESLSRSFNIPKLLVMNQLNCAVVSMVRAKIFINLFSIGILHGIRPNYINYYYK